MINRRLTVSFIFIVFFLISCQSNSESETNKTDELTIYTSIYPIEFLTNKLTGEHANVTSIYPPGVDAHTYEPTSREVTQIAKSDMFIFLGKDMEGFSESVAKSLSSQNIVFVEFGDYDYLFEVNHTQKSSDSDPHIWLDPLRMIDMADIIKSELIELAPEYEDEFNTNFDEVTRELTELDDSYNTVLQEKENKQIIVSHAAYGYWEDRYGIKQIPISGISSTDEPSQKELAKIAELAKDEHLQYVIFDQTGENRLATIIQDHIDAEKLKIHNLEVLTETDLENKDDYITLMKRNLEALDLATD